MPVSDHDIHRAAHLLIAQCGDNAVAKGRCSSTVLCRGLLPVPRPGRTPGRGFYLFIGNTRDPAMFSGCRGGVARRWLSCRAPSVGPLGPRRYLGRARGLS
jgi:hypothetical protein